MLQEVGLQLRHEPPKRRVKAKLPEGRCSASCSNEVYAMGFVHDRLATGPKLRILTLVDTFSRLSPAVVAQFSFRAPDVVEVLERVCSEVGYPPLIRIRQGREFISRDLDLWACTCSVVSSWQYAATRRCAESAGIISNRMSSGIRHGISCSTCSLRPSRRSAFR